MLACDGAHPNVVSVAGRLKLPLLAEAPGEGLVLAIDDDGPHLRLFGPGAPGPVRLSFLDPGLRHRRRGGQNELLGRAIGWNANRHPPVLDATGGFARDAFVLADLGCRVTVCERNPVMAYLLECALAEARTADAWLQGVARHMTQHGGDARELDAPAIGDAEVVYLDPMFPLERKALPTKEMQVLHALLATGEDEQARLADDERLLAWALETPAARVVAKRPLRAPPLPGRAPSHELKGRSVRFDVYTLRPFET